MKIGRHGVKPFPCLPPYTPGQRKVCHIVVVHDDILVVSSLRKVKMASAFVVSDILGKDKWDPQFDARHVQQKLKLLMDAAVDCFCG